MRFIVNSALVLLVGVFIFSVFDSTSNSLPARVPPEKLPDNITPITIEELNTRIMKGKDPQLVLFYASWCPYCKQQLSMMEDLVKKLSRTKRKNIVAVSVDSQPENLARFLDQQPNFSFDNFLYYSPESLRGYMSSFGASFSGSIPYIAIFEGGKLKQVFSGLTPPNKLKPYI